MGSEPSRIRGARGFTLLELLVAIAIAAVLARLGLPPVRNWLADARRTAAINALIGDIQYARSEAIRRRAPVSVCRDTGAGCAAQLGDWTGGWRIVAADLDGGDGEVLRREQSSWRGGAIVANRREFVFHPELRSTNGTWIFCDPRGAEHARAVIVSVTGRPRVADRAADGGPLVC